jgi:expansin (peptidoglycan-binding protein)
MVSGRHRHPGSNGGSRWRWPLPGVSVGGGVVAAVILAVGLGQVTSPQACAAVLSARAAGETGAQSATHYVLQGLPNCSYPSPPADGLYAALPPAEYGNAAACGEYLQVSGPDGSVRVKVIDQCPECAAGHVDLSEAAFARLAPLSAGLISVSYAPVTDPPLPGPLSVEVKQGSSRYWLALLADNPGNPLASVQVQAPSGWVPLARASYNYWIAQSGAGPGPFTVRLTDTQGHQATVPAITLSPGVVQTARTWMYGGGGDAGRAAQAPATSRASAAAGTAAPATAGQDAATARAAATDRPVVARAAPLTPGAPAAGVAAGVARQSRPASSPAPSARSSC